MMRTSKKDGFGSQWPMVDSRKLRLWARRMVRPRTSAHLPCVPLIVLKYHLVEPISPLIEVHLGGLGHRDSTYWLFV